MNRKTFLAVSLGLIALGSLLLLAGTSRAITIHLDGEPLIIESRALTVRQALQDARLTVGPQDILKPPANHWLGWNETITLNRSHPIQIWETPEQNPILLTSTGRIPANLLADEGILLYPGDRLLWNGRELDPKAPLPPASAYTLQLVRSAPIRLLENGQPRPLSAAGTLGDVLWDNGIQVTSADYLSHPLSETLTSGQAIILQPARNLTIQTNNTEITVLASAASVGEALAQAGLPLQDNDYSIPAANEPLPEDGRIRVVHVREEILIEQEIIPFERQFIADDSIELDQQATTQAGQPGIKATRLRVRYEDGQEIDRLVEAEWVASEPRPQIVGYGTQVEVRSLDTPSGQLEYWRAIKVYATSYSPCRSGSDRCYYGTASGLPVQKGVVGVTSEWFSWMAGQRVYIPGYGVATIADVGGGISGKDWIDLGYSDEDFVAWHENVTMYFLTPVPENIPWILP